MGGRDLAHWAFDANNVLAWQDEAGYSAWLQFAVLPGGPVYMGTLHPSGDKPAAGTYTIVVFVPFWCPPIRAPQQSQPSFAHPCAVTCCAPPSHRDNGKSLHARSATAWRKHADVFR